MNHSRQGSADAVETPSWVRWLASLSSLSSLVFSRFHQKQQLLFFFEYSRENARRTGKEINDDELAAGIMQAKVKRSSHEEEKNNSVPYVIPFPSDSTFSPWISKEIYHFHFFFVVVVVLLLSLRDRPRNIRSNKQLTTKEKNEKSEGRVECSVWPQIKMKSVKRLDL